MLPIWELDPIFVLFMRVITLNTLVSYIEQYPRCEQALKSWLYEIKIAEWSTPQELKQMFNSASIISNKRVVFNINGNNYRLIVDIEFRLKIVFIVWFGTHNEYDLIDAKTIEYVKSNKK